MTLNLKGRHQYGNAAVALAVVEVLSRNGFPVSEAAIREGLATARWPGRLERVSQDPRVLLDGAHNPAAALTLAQNLKQARNHGRLILVMGVMADKDVDTILARLLPLAQMVIFTQPQSSGPPPPGTWPGGLNPTAWKSSRPPGWLRPSTRPSLWPDPTTRSWSPVPCTRWGRRRNILRE